MKRLIVTGPREATFDEVSMPQCGDDEIVVRAKLTAISTGTELRVFRAIPVDDEGRFLHERVPFELPTENGYSMVGEVVEAGANAGGLTAGDRVFVPARHKQFVAFPAAMAVKLPDEVSDEHAVFLNILEVSHIALRRGRPLPGENVAILGQGVIGLAALAFCRAYGFRTAAVDLDEARLEIAREMGADLAVSPDEEGFVEKVLEHFGGDGADVVLEAASNWTAIKTGMEIARPEGTIVVEARHTDVPQFNPVGHPFLGKRLTLLTSYGHEPDGHRWDRRHSIARTLDLLSRGQLNIAPMITHRFDWEQLPEAYARLDRGERGLVGIVFRWS